MAMLPDQSSQGISIRGELDLARAVMEARALARSSGFSEHHCFSIATAVSELGRNILKYAGRGEIIISRVAGTTTQGLEILATDAGPGIEDIEEALKDHFSTGGTLGLGLPGVRRLMDDFEIEASPERGTRVRCRKWIPR